MKKRYSWFRPRMPQWYPQGLDIHQQYYTGGYRNAIGTVGPTEPIVTTNLAELIETLRALAAVNCPCGKYATWVVVTIDIDPVIVASGRVSKSTDGTIPTYLHDPS